MPFTIKMAYFLQNKERYSFMRACTFILHVILFVLWNVSVPTVHAQDKRVIEFGNVPDSMIVFTSPILPFGALSYCFPAMGSEVVFHIQAIYHQHCQ